MRMALAIMVVTMTMVIIATIVVTTTTGGIAETTTIGGAEFPGLTKHQRVSQSFERESLVPARKSGGEAFACPALMTE